jgi:putative ABC transport system permease protein
MQTLIQDLRYGMRMLAKNPGFTLLGILTIALGVGANTVIFSVVNAVLLRPLPFPESERLVRLNESHNSPDFPTANLTHATFLDLAGNSETLENIAAARFWSENLAEGGEPEQVSSMLVSADFFAALRVVPALGRTFLPEEDQPGRDRVVILSDGLWRRRYGADLSLVGRTIKVSGVERMVIGVLPRSFQSSFLFPGRYELFVPLVPGRLRENRRSHLLATIARLKPGATIEQAQSELSRFAAQIDVLNPGVDPDLGIRATGLHERLVAPSKRALYVLIGAVACVLLIACANVANLLLARAAMREKEMAIRLSLGASRLRVVRQVMTESALLALVGGATGLLLAVWGVDSISALQLRDLPRLDEVNLDGRVLGFTLLISLLSGFVFGMAPALRLPKLSLNDVLKEGSRGSAGPARQWMREGLVVSEVALALVLLIGAGLLISSFWRLQEVDRGLDPSNVVTLNVTLPGSRYGKGEQQTAFLKQALERISGLPGARSAGVVSSLPFTGGAATDFAIEGRPPFEPSKEPIADIRSVDPGYFRVMGIPLRAGREFTDRDAAGAPQVMIINEFMARQHWPDEDPVGKRVTMLDWGPPLTGEIVGVVGDVKANALDVEARSMIYWPYPQFPQVFNNFVIRTGGDPSNIVGAVKSQIWSVDPELPIARIATMEQLIADSIAPRRFNMLLLGIFAAVALCLAAVGIYGVISYAVSMRTQEIGIRMALGAGRGSVLGLVVRQGMTPALVGLALGLVAAFALTRVMTSLLFEVSATNPLVFGLTSAVLGGVALAACWIPAWRAARVDPMVALRYE